MTFYDTSRLSKQKHLAKLSLSAEAFAVRSAGYENCLSATSSYNTVLAWLEYASRNNVSAFSQYLANNPDLTMRYADFDGPFSPLLNALRQAVNIALAPTGWKNINYSEGLQDAFLEHDELGTMPVSQLSDGIRTVLGLVADLAYRCLQLNPHLGENAALETAGIVMIDEVDMHLHPKWQQTILTDLLRAFPKLQFIVTTHSPQVLSTVKREHIRLIGPERGEIPLAKTYGEPSNFVLQSVMMIDPQPPIAEKANLDELTELVDQGDYASARAKQLMEELIELLGEQHPQLLRLQRSIQRQEALQR